MLKLYEGWKDGDPIDGTYCEECGNQYIMGDTTKNYYVDELDNTFCDHCIVRELISDMVDRENMTKEEQLDYLTDLYEIIYNEPDYVQEVADGVYITSDLPDYEMDVDETINTITDFLVDYGPSETQLNEMFPEYHLTRTLTRYE